MHTICKLVEIAARKWNHKVSTFIVYCTVYTTYNVLHRHLYGFYVGQTVETVKVGRQNPIEHHTTLDLNV